MSSKLDSDGSAFIVGGFGEISGVNSNRVGGAITQSKSATTSSAPSVSGGGKKKKTRKRSRSRKSKRKH